MTDEEILTHVDVCLTYSNIDCKRKVVQDSLKKNASKLLGDVIMDDFAKKSEKIDNTYADYLRNGESQNTTSETGFEQ